MRFIKKTLLLFSCLCTLTGCSFDNSNDEIRTELQSYPKELKNSLNAVISDYELLIKDKIVFVSRDLQSNNEVEILHYTNQKKEIELIFNLDVKYFFCQNIQLWAYGYTDLESPLKEKVENNELTNIFYEKYVPAFDSLNLKELFKFHYEKMKGSGSKNYRNGFIGYN